MPGRRASERPAAANRADSGSTRYFFDGQNSARPSTVTTAGTRVSAASSVTATAIASAGPIARKMPSEESTSAMKATITAPPADAMASPARSSAWATAGRVASPSRSRSR